MPRNPSCRACPLSAGATNVCVWGEWRGEPGTLMVVGEAPGGVEDRQGRPFVGPSGRLLDSTLSSLGIENYYVTNAVKCVSSGPPDSQAIRACAGYLDEEIRAIRPKAILALGTTALHRLVGSGRITEQSGREVWSAAYQCWVLPALHPAAILRAPHREREWRLDLARLSRLGESGHTPIDVEIVPPRRSALESLARDLLFASRVAVDFETVRLPWWHLRFRALTVAFSVDGKRAWVLPLSHPESRFPLGAAVNFLRALTPRLTAWGAHNALFDALVWYRLTGLLPHIAWDSMVDTHLVSESQPLGLKAQVSFLLGWRDWSIDTRQEHPLEVLARYTAQDAAACWQLEEYRLEELRRSPDLEAYRNRLALPNLRAIAAMVARGLPVDRTVLASRLWEARRRRTAAVAELPVSNPNSTAQIARWLYEQEQLPIIKRTPTGRPSTDEETIKHLAQRFPAARRVLEARRWTRYIGTYLRPLAQDLRTSFDGRVHPEYRAAGTDTGRWASRFHTVPRDPFVRSVYRCTDREWELIQADYSQIEARLAAWYAAGRPPTWEAVDPGQASLLLAFRDGRDPYREMASAVLGKPVDRITKQERQEMGKVPMLAMIYRISAQGFRDYAWREHELALNITQAVHIHQTFYRLWPELRLWHQREERLLRARGWTRTPIGRYRRLPEAKSEDDVAAHNAVNIGINMPVQSLASDITQAAHIVLDRLLAQEGLSDRARVVGNVHDALLVEAHRSVLVEVARLLEQVMLAAPEALTALGLRLPPGLLRVEVVTGPWGEGAPL